MKTKSKPIKTHLVEVRWIVSKVYEVEATTKQEAMDDIQRKFEGGELSYFDDGYESTDGEVEYLGLSKD